jgi:tricorn protease
MMTRIKRYLFKALMLMAGGAALAEPVRLAHEPALSPDGSTLAFAWGGDIWTVPTNGGTATRLTSNPAVESGPAFSPDGRLLAFNSDREGSKQVYVMPAVGGDPKRITWHTDGYDVREWMPDGNALLVNIARDMSWMRESRASRLAVLNVNERRAEQVLFDDYASDGAVSADGKRVLFMREGSESWWRQGYRGSRAGQIWIFNRDDSSFKEVVSDGTESRWPMWKPDGKGFYFVSNRDGTYNLWEHDLVAGRDTKHTSFKGDSVVFPAISRDGKTLVLRVKFDLYRWHPGDKELVKIDIDAASDPALASVEHLLLDKATSIQFTQDGLQMAFISGGDVWVMDTELKEPRQVTNTAEEESGVVFAPNGKSLLFISDAKGQTDIWKAVPQKPEKYWWDNSGFTLTRITNDAEAESRIEFTNDGKHIGYVKAGGDLWFADADGKNAKRLIESWNAPSYHFSPDGAWIVYSVSDEWFNADVWLLPVDGSRAAFNLSRHPNNDQSPVWSPDGKMIAWTGKREIDEVDIFYVNLRAEDDERTKRERTLVKAREKMKGPPKAAPTAIKSAPKTDAPHDDKPEVKPDAKPVEKPDEKPTEKPAEKPAEKVKIDFEDIHQRIHRLTIPKSAETTLVWSPDSKKLAFHATIDGKKATYAVEIPDDLKPKQIAATTVSDAQWLKLDDQIVGLNEGKPTSVSAKTGTDKSYVFRAPQSVVRADKQRVVFDQCWQVMRDKYYDERHGNRDWNAVHAKYADMAAAAQSMKGVTEVVWLMLGELNGSHLGFALDQKVAPANTWREETAHLGLRFDPAFAGPGWQVRDVLPKGPASHKLSRIEAGEIILKVDSRDVTPGMDVSEVLNGRADRDITLHVKSAAGAERDVTLRPISYLTARRLLYDKWIEDNRRAVDKASGDKLGYMHISAMDDASFQRFQEQLYDAGAGKEGLVIDVRENGGGFTTDHLLTALTQPQHAITVPRGGKPGYPQDRIIYATWSKPIVVICNQNSYSNAEIFSHSIKTLKRGKLVGVPTAGGVLSTGVANIMDVGTLRLPGRGWYGLNDGKDMELNGAQPDHIVWPKPGDMARGVDAQLAKAVEVLSKDVETWKKRPQPKLIKATERKP